MQNDINEYDNVELTKDIKLSNSEEKLFKNGIIINKNITINGNGHTIDANNKSAFFMLNGKDITLNNIYLTNSNTISAINSSNNNINLNNITIADSTFSYALFSKYSNLTLDNVVFKNNSVIPNNNKIYDTWIKVVYNTIYSKKGNLTIKNSDFYNNKLTYGEIYAHSTILNIDNCNFYNSSSKYASAILTYYSEASINNSKFYNLKSNQTAGAIGLKDTNSIISNCEFKNISSRKNGGAIFNYGCDDMFIHTSLISNSSFINCSAEFGGAILQQAILKTSTIENCIFLDNHATYKGGAIYNSYVNSIINDCKFISNTANDFNQGMGGAIYSDISDLVILNTIIINNSASNNGGAIAAYEGNITLINTNTTFNSEKNSFGIYATFLNNYTFINSNIGDSLSLNNTNYLTVVTGTGAIFDLVNNTIILTNSSKFDLRDYGLLTGVIRKGLKGCCWAASAITALESSILKRTNTTYRLSIDDLYCNILSSNLYGVDDLTEGIEGGETCFSAAYALNWLGILPSKLNEYDELAQIAPIISTNQSFHVQDLMFLSLRKNATDNNEIKNSILNYGPIVISYYAGDSEYFNEDLASYYNPDNITHTNHQVCIVGWDDTYSKDNFNFAPPGDGAFICQNNWGDKYGESGYFYMSYYETSLACHNDSLVFIINNTTPYNKNYQIDLSGIRIDVYNRSSFKNYNSSTIYYANQFTSIDNDLIAAVETYFNSSGVDYEINVYINNELKHSQTGVSPYFGFATIPLTEYIPVSKDDIIFVSMKSNAVPVSELTRVHLDKNTSFISTDGTNWIDQYENKSIVCLKVYTIADNSSNIVDLDIKTSVDKEVIAIGDIVKVIFTLENFGPDIAQNTYVKIELPEGFEVISINQFGTFSNSEDYIWNLGNITPVKYILEISGKFNKVGKYNIKSTVNTTSILTSERIGNLTSNVNITVKDNSKNETEDNNASNKVENIELTSKPTGNPLILTILVLISISLIIRRR